jgi:hypothetical protein
LTPLHSAQFSPWGDFLLTLKAIQKTLHRKIRSQFQGKGKGKIPCVATDHEISHGRNIARMLRAK